jgi:hypothetical protein
MHPRQPAPAAQSEPSKARAALGFGSAVAQDEQQQQRNPEAAGEFAEGRALVGREQAHSRKRAPRIRPAWPRLRRAPGGPAPASPGPSLPAAETSARSGTSLPGQHESQRRAQHPRQRRIEDEPRLARAISLRSAPSADTDPVPPAVQAHRTTRPDGSRSRARRSCPEAVAARRRRRRQRRITAGR